MTAETGSARVTVLHIGTMKSGTSYLQHVLSQNKDALQQAGVHYLGRGTRAVWDVLSLRPGTGKTVGAWQRLVDHAHTTAEPKRLLSMEILSTASDDGAKAIVESLQPDRIEVVVTARDMARVVPSAWQNAVKHGGQMTFPEFVDSVTSGSTDRTAQRFWKQHDVSAIVTRWAAVVGAHNVHLVTVPGPGAPPDLLWSRFAAVLTLDPAAYDTSQGQSSNFSLSFSDAELLRRINRRIGDELSREHYNRYIRTFLANEVMRPPSKSGPADAAVLDAAAHEWAHARGEQMAAELAASGVHVVGDLADLVPAPYDGGLATSQDGPGAPASAGAVLPRVTYPDSAVRVISTLLRKLVETDPAAADSQRSERQRSGRAGGRRRARRVRP